MPRDCMHEIDTDRLCKFCSMSVMQAYADTVLRMRDACNVATVAARLGAKTEAYRAVDTALALAPLYQRLRALLGRRNLTHPPALSPAVAGHPVG